MTELNAGIRGLSGSLNHLLLRFFPNKVASDEKQNGFKDKVKDIVAQVLPPNEVELETIKDEVWGDLSALYYKYEDDGQKRAFREVMHEICDILSEGKWDMVYSKIYRSDQKERQ